MPNWKAHPQSADGYVWIMQPRTVFAARVNMTEAAYPLAELTYDGVTTGAFTDLEMGMTLLVGSAPGLWDLGRIYVRGDVNHEVATSTIIRIGYCSRGHNVGEVDLIDNSYLTVLDLFEPWRRASRMLDDGTVLKDYDWGFGPTTPPVAHVGSLGGLGTVGFVDGTNFLAVNDFDASGSYVTAVGSPTITLTQWDFKDGTITAGTDTDPAPEVKFPPGYRWVKLDAGDSLASDALPRHFCVAALEASGVNAPKRVRKARWKLTPEGVTFNCELWERLDPAEYIPGTVVMFLTAQDYDGDTVWIVSFAGYLNYDQSSARALETDTERGTTLYALDVAGRMAQQRTPPSTIARAALPLNVNQLAGADLDRYLWWTLYWHSFVPMLTDFQWSGRTDYPFSDFSAPGGDLYAVTDGLARAIGYRLTMDARGRLRMRLDPWRQPEDERDPATSQNIDEGDWTALERTKKPFPRQGVLRSMASLTSSADAHTLTEPAAEIHAVAPGTVEGVGVSEGQSGYRWLVQSASEQQVRLGEDYQRANAHEELLRLTLAHGLDGGIEPADMTPVALTASVENVGWHDDVLTAEHCLPASVDFTFDDEAGAITQQLTVERANNGAPSAWDPIALASTPPYAGGRYGNGLWAGVNTLALINSDGYVYLLNQLTHDVTRYALAPLGMQGDPVDFVVAADSPLYLGTGTTVNVALVTTTHFYFLTDIAGTPALSNEYAFAFPAAYRTRHIQGSRSQPGVYVINSHEDDASNDIDITTDDGENFTRTTHLGGEFSAGAGDDGFSGVHASEHTANRAWVAVVSVVDPNYSQIYQTDDAGATWDEYGDPIFGAVCGLTIPYTDTAEAALYTSLGGSDPAQPYIHSVKVTPTTQTDISAPTPYVGTNFGGISSFSLKFFDLDADIAQLVGWQANIAYAGVWATTDRCVTWVEQIAPFDTAGSAYPEAGNIAGDNPLYRWTFGAGGWFQRSVDGGASWEDYTSDFSVFVGIGVFLNICGVN